MGSTMSRRLGASGPLLVVRWGVIAISMARDFRGLDVSFSAALSFMIASTSL
jgi:hypothetical protein